MPFPFLLYKKQKVDLYGSPKSMLCMKAISMVPLARIVEYTIYIQDHNAKHIVKDVLQDETWENLVTYPEGAAETFGGLLEPAALLLDQAQGMPTVGRPHK